MGNVCSNNNKIDQGSLYKISKKIDSDLKKEVYHFKKLIRMLLLGSGESGKTTIVKQMRIINNKDFQDSEVINYKYMVLNNLIISLHYIAQGIEKLNIFVPDNEHNLYYKLLTNHISLIHSYDDFQVAVIQELRTYKCVNEILERRHAVFLPDNTDYFFENLDRVLTDDYLPSTDDIIRIRAPSSGINEVLFSFQDFSIMLIDVGGQKTERRKWMYCFEGVTAILFVMGLSCYDQNLIEDQSKNCLEDSLDLFYMCYSNKFLSKSSFILFLNKKDIFETKLKFSPLKNYLPKYTGDNSYESASKFIKRLYFKHKDGRVLYSHFTNATDTSNIQIVYDSIVDTVLKENMKEVGLQQ